MRLLIIALLAALIPSGVTLDATMTTDGLRFVVQSDAPRHFYVQLDPVGGATIQSPIIYEFDLDAGESFGRVVSVSGPGSVAVRVWASDGGEDPVAEQVVVLPTRRTYLPLLYRA